MIYTKDECVERAQLFIECANEAWQQLSNRLRGMDGAPDVIHEIDAYLAAAGVLLAYRNDVGRLQKPPAALFIRLADAYTTTDDEAAQKSVAHLN